MKTSFMEKLRRVLSRILGVGRASLSWDRAYELIQFNNCIDSELVLQLFKT